MNPQLLFEYIVAVIAGIGVGVFILGILIVLAAVLWSFLD